MKKNILEAVRVIRSKNSGPFELTLDLLFKNRELFTLFRQKNWIDRTRIAQMYGVEECEVLGILYFEPALALKITLKRVLPSGSPGDGDVYGAQQHAPLLEIEYEEE